jgi:hypothetical protein
MKTQMHENSMAAYRSLSLTHSQATVARAILSETRAGRASTIDSLFRRYGIMPTSGSARIGELRKMSERGEAFTLDGEEYALIVVDRVLNPSGRPADAYKLESFAVVREKWMQQQAARQIGVQTEMQL